MTITSTFLCPLDTVPQEISFFVCLSLLLSVLFMCFCFCRQGDVGVGGTVDSIIRAMSYFQDAVSFFLFIFLMRVCVCVCACVRACVRA